MRRWLARAGARMRTPRRGHTWTVAVRALACAVVPACATPAQSTPPIALDSVTVLNRTGEWTTAATLGERLAGDPRYSASQQCAALLGAGYARLRLGLVDSAWQLVQVTQRRCPTLPPSLERERAQLAADVTGASSHQAGSAAPTVQVAPRAADDWRVARPTDVGVDTLQLRRHRELCARTGADACLVVRYGALVDEWYAPSYREPVYAMSTTKSITGLLTVMLLADGRLPSLETPVCRYVEEWCEGPRSRATVRHLLTMTSGLLQPPGGGVGTVGDKNRYVRALAPSVPAGSQWFYSNEGAQLLSPVLDAIAGEPIQAYAQRRLFTPLGLHQTRLHLDTEGHAWTYADMETSARDMARLGVLIAQHGAWQGQQLLPTAFVDSLGAPSTRLNTDYGLLWWRHPQLDGLAAHGHLDTHIHVFPKEGLVIVRVQARPSRLPEGTYEREALALFPYFVSGARARPVRQ